MTRIFVVEDDRDIAELITHYFEKAGWQPQTFASGREALTAARRRPPDCIVLDLMLPGMDGLDGCRALRSDRAPALVPIIMLTMERLVKELLRLARLDARQELLEIARCDVRQLFEAVLVDLAPSVDAKRQRVTVDVDDRAAAVHGDGAKLHDVIRNLLENAVNYSPPEAEILLAARRDERGVRIEVADSGPGIPADDLSRVFERFYRVDKSRTGPGTGLGFAIVKHLVELHGGGARRQPAPWRRLFTITLPDR